MTVARDRPERPKSSRLLVIALALWFGVSGAWSIYANLGGVQLSPERIAAVLSTPHAPEDMPGIHAGLQLGWLAGVGIFGVLALVASTGLLTRARWARWASLIYLTLAIVIRLMQSVGVAMFVERTRSVIDQPAVSLTALLAPWAAGIVLRFLALVYLARTDPAKP